MKKHTKRTVKTSARRPSSPSTVSVITLRRVKDTTNYAKFELIKEKDGPVAAFGQVYIPLADANGKQSLTVL
jgi:hypothetical protein